MRSVFLVVGEFQAAAAAATWGETPASASGVGVRHGSTSPVAGLLVRAKLDSFLSNLLADDRELSAITSPASTCTCSPVDIREVGEELSCSVSTALLDSSLDDLFEMGFRGTVGLGIKPDTSRGEDTSESVKFFWLQSLVARDDFPRRDVPLVLIGLRLVLGLHDGWDITCPH